MGEAVRKRQDSALVTGPQEIGVTIGHSTGQSSPISHHCIIKEEGRCR